MKRKLSDCVLVASFFASAVCVDTALGEYSKLAVMPSETVSKIADAVFRAEGGYETKYPYGIIRAHSANPRLVCINTINHAWKDFEGEQRFGGSANKPADVSKERGVSLPFIQFLGLRYCPPSVDSVGYRNWTNNVWRIINK